jgi:putative transposase
VLVATEKLRITHMTRSAAGTMEKPGENVAQKADLNRGNLDNAPALFTSLIRQKVLETAGGQRCPACWALNTHCGEELAETGTNARKPHPVRSIG